MSTLVPIPKLGQSEETVKIEKWRVKEGDKIKKGDVLFEVETDKAVLEVESQFEGTVLKIVVQEGVEVPVMTTALILGEPGETIPDIKIEAIQKKVNPPVNDTTKTSTQEKTSTYTQTILSAKTSTSSTTTEPIQQTPQFKAKPSPRARQFAKNFLINLDDITGTGGKNRRVTEADVKKYLEESGYFKKKITGAAFNLAKKENLTIFQIEGSGEDGRITLADVKDAIKEKPKELTSIRKIIAKRLSESKRNIPHFYVTVSVDLTDLINLRKKLKDEGLTLSINDFIIKATSLSLREFPMLNSECNENYVKYKSKINIGMAVSLEGGLVVPVIKNADKKALDEIHAEAIELADAARTGKLAPDKMKGGTFTISNMGMLDVENFAAIINPGESAILAVSSAIATPIAKNNQVLIRDIMKMTVSADHRIVDGADAAKFANNIKKRLENPSELL